MFKIGEFSRLVRVSPRMLRHYERCGLLYPARTDGETGYRWYGAGQIPLVMRIVALRDVGFSIDEIGDILPRFADAAYMEATLRAKASEIKAAIRSGDERLRRVEAMRNELTKEKKDMQYEVVLKELPAIKVLSLRKVIPDYSREGDLWARMGEFLAAHGIPCPAVEESGYSIYHDEDYKETDVDVEIAVPVEAPGTDADGFVYRELAAMPLAATLRFAGPYDGYAKAIADLAAWVEQNGYEMVGSVRGVAIRTPADQSDPRNFLTELQVPVRKAGA